MRRSEAIIDLDALRHNAQLAKSTAPNSKLIGVIKANAYGHGVVQSARTLDEICDAYAVAFIDEAIELQDSGVTKDIFSLEGFFDIEELTIMAERNIAPMIHHPFQLDLLRDYSGPALAQVMVKFDTGMHRLGFTNDQIDDALGFLTHSDKVDKVALATHFASSDDVNDPLTAQQWQMASDKAAEYDLDIAAANSAAILSHHNSHGTWNRAGIMLYGSNPFGMNDVAASNQLKPVMTLNAPVIAVRTIPTGDSVGYSHNWTAERESTIATLAIGYADGYPRVVKSGTQVYINGCHAPIVGNVSMDMITIDVTDVPDVKIGDTAQMWGDTVTIDMIADAAGTIGYELLTKVTKRIPRRYIGD